MQWLSTVLSTVAAVVAVVAAIYSHRSHERAAFEGRKVAGLRGRLLTAESQVEALTTQHRKLSGRFYAALGMIERDTLQRQDEEADADVCDPPPRRAELTNSDAPQLLACDNWKLAQLEGPTSPAASCECDFCVHMREQRRRVKEALVPKGQAARVAEMRRGLAQR